jgi:phage terminase large subunit-like protein
MSEACGDLEGLLDRCEVAVAAIDGGGLDDLAGLTVVGRERVTKRWLYWSHGWVQEDVLFLRKEIAPKLTDFAEAGELTLCREVNDDIAGMVEILTTVRASG